MKQIFNKKAAFNFHLLEKLEAGIILTGNEIKSVRAGKVSLAESFVLIKSGEAVLVNAHIAPYEKGASASADPKRDRKLLLQKKEIDYLIGKLAGSNLDLVPTRLYFKHNYAKIEIALARSKKTYDKRAVIKQKEQEREAQAILREEKLRSQKET
jgi:SsrA-binding protein